ncbi:pantothenate kinase [Romeria aff. gracilis LEGE 07310]|uniref:Type III pantothenate kinase n=1 Tax=Vasconcelosia minhoensis LEGE 07310 TaxID=915328 RepID=A0A8J7AJM5_9CYAN|nr:pantothenate kinase [Romeria gracilis]MBE9076590.1 pantothenate kinase [Romeria aff. gracilis LEGE 07310]
MADDWLALAIGNSRLHWAAFRGQQLLQTWHTLHLPPETVARLIANGFQPAIWAGLTQDLVPLLTQPGLWLASVVPQQTAIWAAAAVTVEPEQIPLKGCYSGLGLDRILTLWGAAWTGGWPALAIDAGTALTLTAGDADTVLGGAILPGLRLQSQALAQGTAALPAVSWHPRLPPRWAKETTAAIQSGILYTLLSGLQDYLDDWWQTFPQGQVVLTGGDGSLIHTYLQQCTPEVASRVRFDPALIFRGICAYRETTAGAEC